MRSCEVRILRTADIDRSDPGCWFYRPAEHKNDWRENDQGRARYREACYTDWAYCQAVRRACRKAGVRLTPYQGRHATKQRIIRAAELDAARAVLGQTSLGSTNGYAHQLDLTQAAEVMARLG